MQPSNVKDNARQNALLAALPDEEFEKIFPALEPITIETGEILWEAESKRRHIYFPTTGLICLLFDSDNGMSIQVGITGRLGLAGVSTFMSEASMATRAVAYRSGEVFRMKADDVKSEFGECGDFQDVCMYYTQTHIAQISQSAICNRLHSVEQQFCRFLLHMQDHQQTNVILLTHEQIAHALGVRRETVSLAASDLREHGIIKYSRGRIRLLDRKRLQDFGCECYAIETDHYRRVLGKYIEKHK